MKYFPRGAVIAALAVAGAAALVPALARDDNQQQVAESRPASPTEDANQVERRPVLETLQFVREQLQARREAQAALQERRDPTAVNAGLRSLFAGIRRVTIIVDLDGDEESEEGALVVYAGRSTRPLALADVDSGVVIEAIPPDQLRRLEGPQIGTLIRAAIDSGLLGDGRWTFLRQALDALQARVEREERADQPARELRLRGVRIGLLRGETITGEIESLSTVEGSDEQEAHVVARVRTSNDRLVQVDLGPEINLDRTDLSEGVTVTIRGLRGRVEGQSVLMATTVTVGDQRVIIRRPREPEAVTRRPFRPPVRERAPGIML